MSKLDFESWLSIIYLTRKKKRQKAFHIKRGWKPPLFILFDTVFNHGYALIMAMKEGHIEYPGGLRIRYRLNEHEKDVQALLIHGAGHRLEEYDAVFPYFDAHDIALSTIELRGHGASGGMKLHINSFDEYVTDIKRFIAGQMKNRPVYIITEGSSVISALLCATDSRVSIQGIAALSPAIITDIPFGQKLAISFSAKFLPKRRLGAAWNAANPVPQEKTREDDDEAPVTRFTASYYRALLKGSIKAFKVITTLTEIPSLIITDASPASANSTGIFKRAYRKSQKLSIIETKKENTGMLHGVDRIDTVEKICRWIHRQENFD
jgi:pimeloyl-ACP methyl ester carboxylesterase